MRVQVTKENIIEYGLDIVTGNSTADLLARAMEMYKAGYDLYVNIPDQEGGDKEAPNQLNIFEIYNDPIEPTPEGLTHKQESVDLAKENYISNPCGYRQEVNVDYGEIKWICVVHNAPSKHSIVPGSHEPCLQIDPYDD